VRCLFLAPLKSPDDPVPSGERTMARLYMKALRAAGYQVELASQLRTRLSRPSAADWDRLTRQAEDELHRLADGIGDEPVACVFTYHVYYKAPDLIGPALADRIGVPYVIAEASRAPKRATGATAEGHARAECAIDAARLLLTPTAADREMLERFRPPGQHIVDLKPFIDASEWPRAFKPRLDRLAGPTRLITVAMMRERDKLASYLQLAQALRTLPTKDWTLDVIGDGPARETVQAAFADIGTRVTFHGAVPDRPQLGDLLAQADIFVWPGVNEAFGAAYLEAQAHGLPCVAGRHGGIADAIADGVTGILSPAGDINSFAQAISRLITDATLRRQMSEAAIRFMRDERSLPAATNQLGQALEAAGIALPRRFP